MPSSDAVKFQAYCRASEVMGNNPDTGESWASEICSASDPMRSEPEIGRTDPEAVRNEIASYNIESGMLRPLVYDEEPFYLTRFTEALESASSCIAGLSPKTLGQVYCMAKNRNEMVSGLLDRASHYPGEKICVDRRERCNMVETPVFSLGDKGRPPIGPVGGNTPFGSGMNINKSHRVRYKSEHLCHETCEEWEELGYDYSPEALMEFAMRYCSLGCESEDE